VYFGYQTMWTFSFLPIGFVLVMGVSIALGLIYAVGSSRGKDAALRYLRVCTVVLLVGGALDIAYAVATGQLARFVAAYGIVPLLEMSVLALMCVGAMALMASSYVSSKT